MVRILSDHEVTRMVERIAFRQIHIVLDELAGKVRGAMYGREDQPNVQAILRCVDEMEGAARCFEDIFGGEKKND